jgi:hypothetical protein
MIICKLKNVMIYYKTVTALYIPSLFGWSYTNCLRKLCFTANSKMSEVDLCMTTFEKDFACNITTAIDKIMLHSTKTMTSSLTADLNTMN